MSDQAWPITLDYVSAVESATSTFRIPQLRSAKFMADGNGPRSLEGQRAVVFFADTDEGPLAVRCLKTPVPSGAERYAALRHYLTQHPVPALIRADWVENGIQVKGYPWPVVTMERVAGRSLLTFVRRNLGQPDQLRQLAADWRTLVAQLSAADIAHGDLQQDNVMLADDRRLRLIDLDAVWIPTLTHLPPPPERGHPHFQHPERTHAGYWGRYVDAFPALVIYISLLALAADPVLLDLYNNEDNLIFSDEDFVGPGKTGLWYRLWASPDLELRRLVSILERYCRASVRMDTNLEQLLARDGFPVTAPGWVSPGISAIRHAWWASLPAEVAPPAELVIPAPKLAGIPPPPPVSKPGPPVSEPGPLPASEPVPLAADATARFTADNLAKDWWNRPAAGPSGAAPTEWPGQGAPPAGSGPPQAPSRTSRPAVVNYAIVAALLVLVIIVILAVA